MNREKAVRLGIGEAIRGNLSYESVSIKVYDEVTTNEIPGEEIYVLFTQQTAQNDSLYNRFLWRCVQTMEIVSKQFSSVSKDIVDDISEQIEQIIIYPNNQPGEGYTTVQSGWEIKDILLESVTYTEFELERGKYEITKILNVSCIALKIS
jgi:hypothetical protein